MARLAGIENEIVLRITTDGKRVVGVTVTKGSPGTILAAAAEENARTWQFVEHAATTFTATFRYKLLPDLEAVDDLDSGIVTLRLPTEVEVTAARADMTMRDPAVESHAPGK